MNVQPGGKPPRRRTSTLFAVLLGLGLLMLVGRMAALPEFSLGEALVPALGGILMIAALAVIVIRDRRERAALTSEQRDRQNQGTPN